MNATVLIVDDERNLRDGLSEAVRDLGYEALVAASGREALVVAATNKPDAVLLDLRMPDMDGLQVLTGLRAAAAGANVPVAIITAHATAANTIEAMRLGAFDHLTKPIGREDLASLLPRMVRSRAHKSPAPNLPDAEGFPETLIGSSAGMREVQKTIGLGKALRVGQVRGWRLMRTRSDHARQQRGQILAADRLRQWIECAEPHRFNGVRRRGVGRDNGNRHVRACGGGAQTGQDLEPVHVRHPQVEQHGIGLVRCRNDQRFASGNRNEGLISEIANGLGKSVTQIPPSSTISTVAFIGAVQLECPG